MIFDRKIPCFLLSLLLLCLSLSSCAVRRRRMETGETEEKNREEMKKELPDYVTVDLIDVDGASRRGVKLEGVTAVVVHYVANPGTTAKQNRDYFNNPESETSSHFIIGLQGEVLLVVPLDEKSSATGERNRDTISIEVCHPKEDGAFTKASYERLVELCAWLCEKYSLDPESGVIRHYDVTGKNCPKYFVEHPDEWDAFKKEVQASMKGKKK